MSAKENICPRCGSDNTGLRDYGANKYGIPSSTIDIDKYQEEWFCYDCNKAFFQLFVATFVGQSLEPYTGKNDLIISESIAEIEDLYVSILNRIKMGDIKEAESLLFKLHEISKKEI
jgi:hypothetical protein